MSRVQELHAFCFALCKDISSKKLPTKEKPFILLKKILRFFQAAEGGIILLSGAGQDYQHYSLDKKGDEFLQEETALSLAGSLAGICIESARPVVMNDLGRKLKLLKGREIPSGTKNLLLVPFDHSSLGRSGIYFVNSKVKGGFDQKIKKEIGEIAVSVLPLLHECVNSIELGEEVDALRRTHQFQEDMIHMVVHDLKGPLAEVIANLDLLKSSKSLDVHEAETLESAEKGCTNLWEMILGILDLAKLQDNKLSLKKEKVDVIELIDSLLDGLKRHFGGKFLTSVFDPEEEFPLIEADKNLLGRVLNNLVLNAIHYSPEGERITVSLKRLPAKRLAISIMDEGRGIKEEDIPFIFEKFNLSSEGGIKSSTGLGLTFCKMAIEAHKGEITVESATGKGSTFHVVLPIGASRLQLDRV